MKKHYWFQWERQATVHPILMCMEAWMEPMQKAYGKSWPSTVIIYNKDLVGWYTPWNELLEYGQYCIDLFIKPNNQQKFETDVKNQAKELELLFVRLDSTNIKDISNGELQLIYDEIRMRWTKWFVPGGLVEPIGHQGEKLLHKYLEGNPNASKIFSLITTTTRDSFSKRELQDLLKIAIAKKDDTDISKMLAQHAKKYYWVHNGYYSTEVLGVGFFEKEISNAMSKYPDIAGQLKTLIEEPTKIRTEKFSVIQQLNLNEYERNLVELLDLFAWYQDYRKEYTMRMLHYLNVILCEISRRTGFSEREIWYTLPSEIQQILSGKLENNIACERMQHCLFHWDTKVLEHGVGDFASTKEKEIFHSISHKDDIIEVTGMVASKGSVRGKARVTMSAKEAHLVQPGEILVTSMTTPDFVTAVKKASAIVTNEGGVLCHAAVVSREFGIPCIVGTRIATKIFKTGDMLEVDGELGVVRKV
ncbi:MAG: PEP-utilizing enzyme [Candidatus Micrarchaeota archaeon]